jgi:hypothetical protein
MGNTSSTQLAGAGGVVTVSAVLIHVVQMNRRSNLHRVTDC